MPTSKSTNTSAMQEARQKISEQKLQTLKVVLEDMLKNHEAITPKRVVELAGVSKQYLYNNKEANALYMSAKEKSQQITPFDNEDILLQYEEVKRKLQDSYILQYQLLSAENERLRQEIIETESKVSVLRAKRDEKIAYQKASPKFKLHIIPTDMPEDELVTYQLITSTGKILNPVGKKIINNIIWGEHVLISSKYDFELESVIDGIRLDHKNDSCVLIITDKVKDSIMIKMLVRPKSL